LKRELSGWMLRAGGAEPGAPTTSFELGGAIWSQDQAERSGRCVPGHHDCHPVSITLAYPWSYLEILCQIADHVGGSARVAASPVPWALRPYHRMGAP
jgi:hypothetical protein